MMNKLGKGNWFLMFVVLIVGMAVFVLASAPSWNGAPDTNYTTSEGSTYSHNLSANITGFGGDVTFAIDTTQTSVYLTNASGRNAVTSSYISPWISITNSTAGTLTINATYDNQTGFFEIPIQAKNVTDDAATTEVFEFIINATDDSPTFVTTVFDHNWSSSSLGNYTISLLDEEEHYPLNFSMVSIDNCTHGGFTGKAAGAECDIFDLANTSSVAATIGLNQSYSTDLVGIYWYNLTVIEAEHSCPHAYCDNETYNVTRNVSTILRFEVQTSLLINVSNCTGQTVMQDEQFNCTINITTVSATDSLDLSTYANFVNVDYTGSNKSWFYANNTLSASNSVLSVPISITPTKNKVGNWTINFTAEDANGPITSAISLYVNFTESSPSLGVISDIEIYENENVLVDATDDDLLILDSTVKVEDLTFAVNWSSDYISITEGALGSGANYITANISINYSAFLEDGGEGNYSVKINVTDSVGSFVDNQTFVVTIWNNTAPTWNSSDVYQFSGIEDTEFYLNLTDGYVNDSDGDSLNFSFSNDTRFDNFNLTDSGIINFTSTDVDVGQHLVSIVAGDGKQNVTRSFNISISNLDDSPSIVHLYNTSDISVANGTYQTIAEDSEINFTLNLLDYDFLIPDYQVTNYGAYNESLTVDVVVTNSTGADVDLFEFVFGSESDAGVFSVQYLANFTPTSLQADNYTIFINVSDSTGLLTNRTFFLNVTATDDAPVLDAIVNQSTTINDVFSLDIDATDEEDGDDSTGSLTYNLTFVNGTDFVAGDATKFNTTTGIFNVTLSSLAGEYVMNVSVNDSTGNIDWQVFELDVYGLPNISAPLDSYTFEGWTEAVATGDLDFNISYDVNNTDLTYLFYMDKIVYSNLTNYNYTTLINESSLRNTTVHTWVQESNLSWNFTPNYTDETYGMLKNLTLVVYNADYPELNDSVNWKVNISHTNQDVNFFGISIPDKGPVSCGNIISVDLTDYFEDADYWDETINQVVNFTINTVSGSGQIASSSSFDDWVLNLYFECTTTGAEEILEIVAHEYDSNNVSSGNATSDTFTVEFTPPTTTTVTTPSSGGGGGSTRLKHFSLKLIVPQDIVISDENYIEVPFAVQNNGQMDLQGINLSSYVSFNDVFSDNVRVSLMDGYIEDLKFGQSENFTMRIVANTQKSGKYKATVWANVTSPKFSDWADFFIELKKTNDSEAEQLLVFTEKFVAENPECLELTELLREATYSYELGEISNSMKITQEVVEACEDAIIRNDQVRYPIAGFVKDNFYYISFSTLVIFMLGFVFYVYKRVRFNKSKMDRYV